MAVDQQAAHPVLDGGDQTAHGRRSSVVHWGLLLVSLWSVFGAAGCHRQFYRRQADMEMPDVNPEFVKLAKERGIN